ncbi:hypothetical protein DM02DRAFT_617505 [Periconia macrospinosa]|uniref:Ubiquitin-like domain-containing protein n=1 Tax=Periconia macrospinosa TaxID=97972 RepID=A0A2V1DD78_9PLEO|nr:hypothetical protein DM02DRAFT_617505 [Periconia macrospinosa]
MTDGDAGATAAPPPKKRSFFKKAAWQTQAPKSQDEPEADMFSHSNTFDEIVAEEARLKLAAKKKAEAARKRKAEELQSRAKRKASVEVDANIGRSESRDLHHKTRSNLRSVTPKSPIRSKSPLDTLATRYESFTRSSNSSFSKEQPSHVIDLDDSDGEKTSPYRSSTVTSPVRRTIPAYTVPLASSSDVEEGEDPELVELRAKARARAAAKTAQVAEASATPEVEQQQTKSPVVQLLMTSEIPDTKPLMVKVRLDTTLEKPRSAWCARQGFTPAQARDIFITFKMREIYDTTLVERLDLTNMGNGCVMMKGDETLYDEENLARPQVQLWTRELFNEYKKIAAEEAAAVRAAEQASYEEPEPEPEPKPVPQIHLFLRAKDKNVWKIIVKPDTVISHLMDSYKRSREVPPDQPITLMFDDERLKPMDVISDYDIEDNDTVDVYFK